MRMWYLILLGLIRKIDSTPLLGRLEMKTFVKNRKKTRTKQKNFTKKNNEKLHYFFWVFFFFKTRKNESNFFWCFVVLIDARLEINMQLKQKKTNQKKKEKYEWKRGRG